MPFPEFTIAVDDPKKAGLLEKFGVDSRIKLPLFVKDTGVTNWYRFARQALAEDLVHEEYDVSAATIEAAIGLIGQLPTGGTFSLTFAGSGTGMTALSPSITAAALSTAINSNAAVTSAGGVTVTQIGNEFLITFVTVGDKTQFVATGSLLTPSSTIEVITVINGGASTNEVQLLRLAQQPWAYTNVFTPTSTGTVTATNVRAGTSTLPHIHRIAISPEPYGGAFNVTFALEAAIKQQWLVTILGDTAGSLGSKFFDVVDLTGIVRIWLNNGGSAPNTPTGGRLLAVAYTNGDSASVLAGKIVTAVDADAALTSYLFDSITPKIHIGLATAGAPADYPADAQNSTFTLVQYVAGTNGETLSAQVPYNTSAEQLSQLLGENFTVTKTGPFQWDLTRTILGLQPDITVASAGLLFPLWYEAELDLNRLALHQAFANSTEDRLEATFEVRVTQPGALPLVVLQMPVVVARNLIELATLAQFVLETNDQPIMGFANEAAVAAATPDFDGQLAYAIAQGTFWFGQSGAFVGSWALPSLSTADMLIGATGSGLTVQGNISLDKTITAGGTTGAQTINKNAGSVNFAAGAASLVVTNSRVSTGSVILCTVATNDTTMKSASAVAASGSFTLRGNANPTAETRVNFLVLN